MKPNQQEAVEPYSYPNSKWRTARKQESRCANWGKFKIGGEPADKVCVKTIKIGDRYWDSGESDSRMWATWKLCEPCAKADGHDVVLKSIS